MKKSIFLFFAAILCAMSASAWSYKSDANGWKASTSGFTTVTMNSGKSMSVVMLKDVGDGVNICQNDDGNGQKLYCKWTKTSGDIFRGTARWNSGLYSDETVVIPGGIVYIKVGSGAQVQMTAGADYTYTADVTFSNTGESYTISGGTVSGATINNESGMPAGGKPASLTMSNSYTSKNAGNVHIVFDLKTNKVTETADSEPEPVADVTVHVINSAKWAAVACYHWGEGGAGTEWPGDVLSKTNEFAGYDVYTATFTGEHTSCIFNNNNNGKQTGDLTVQNGQYYDLKSNKWYASLAEVPAPDPLATDVFLAGSMNGWSTTANEFKKVEEGSATATLTMNLEAETEYEFKVVREGAWTSRKDQDDDMTITETIEGLQFSSSSSKNCKMKTNLAGSYIFTWEISTSKLSITYPTEEVIITYTYTIAGAEALVGSYWSTTDTNNDMADADNDGVYTLTKTDRTLAKGTYEYKVVYDHDWDVGQYPASGQGNKSVSIEEDGIYTIEFTFNPGTKELNAAPTKTGEAAITHTVQLAGSMTEWATSPIDFTVDGTTATLETTLQAGLHEFKIIADGNWLTNSGTMTRLSSSEWTFGTGDNNAKLFAEIAGTYKFTWDIDNSKLTVVFPDFDGTYPTIGIAGDMNEWEGSTNQSSTVVDGKTTVAITLEEQKTYEFKVCVGDVMLGNPGTMQNSSSTGWEFHTYDGNAKIMTYAAGEYQFVWEHAKHQLSVIYPDGEITTLPEVYLAGSMLGNENWDAGKQAFVASADEKTASYTYNFAERDKTYEFKIIQNESWLGNSGNMKRSSCEGWTFDVHNSSNASIYMDIPGDYVFTWEYATNKLTVTYPTLPTVALRGTMCNGTGDAQWLENNQILLQTMDDQAHAYVKVNLEANTYEFKIFEGDSWLSNNDAGTMDKSNNANWPFTTTQNNNT
ncbi:MAG: starch-binding protein [Paludibacteraceae bacterium]|nr:starch-binding protein [Paludibacteraceae bacterium]